MSICVYNMVNFDEHWSALVKIRSTLVQLGPKSTNSAKLHQFGPSVGRCCRSFDQFGPKFGEISAPASTVRQLLDTSSRIYGQLLGSCWTTPELAAFAGVTFRDMREQLFRNLLVTSLSLQQPTSIGTPTSQGCAASALATPRLEVVFVHCCDVAVVVLPMPHRRTRPLRSW